MSPNDRVVAYEDFGAIGDGVADDLPAICAAHAHANQQRLRVRSKADATYHLGSRALTAVVETDTDWNTSRFTIDDTQVEDHRGRRGLPRISGSNGSRAISAASAYGPPTTASCGFRAIGNGGTSGAA